MCIKGEIEKWRGELMGGGSERSGNLLFTFPYDLNLCPFPALLGHLPCVLSVLGGCSGSLSHWTPNGMGSHEKAANEQQFIITQHHKKAT